LAGEPFRQAFGPAIAGRPNAAVKDANIEKY
jgi:hypothetical protein